MFIPLPPPRVSVTEYRNSYAFDFLKSMLTNYTPQNTADVKEITKLAFALADEYMETAHE